MNTRAGSGLVGKVTEKTWLPTDLRAGRGHLEAPHPLPCPSNVDSTGLLAPRVWEVRPGDGDAVLRTPVGYTWPDLIRASLSTFKIWC